MKVKDGVKIYDGIDDIREFEPQSGEFFCFRSKRKGKERIFVEEAGVRCIGEFYNFDDAFRFAKFKKQEGDINQIFERYERVRDQLTKIVNNLDLQQCKKCGNFHHKEYLCRECGYDQSGDKFHK